MSTPKSRRGRKKTDSCAVLVVLAGSLISLGWFLNSAAGWLV